MKKAFWHYRAPQFGGGGSEIYKSSVWRIPKKDRLQLWLQCAAAEAQGLVSSRPFAEIWWFQAGSGASLWTRIAVTEQGFNARSPSVERRAAYLARFWSVFLARRGAAFLVWFRVAFLVWFRVAFYLAFGLPRWLALVLPCWLPVWLRGRCPFGSV